MKNWFTSRRVAVTLAAITLITHLWRGFLDAMLVLPVDFNDETLIHVSAVIYTLLFTGWAWTLFKAWQGRRAAWMALFILNALLLLAVPIGWLLFYCPAECRAQAGLLFNLANTANLVFGLLSGITLAVQLWKPAPVPQAAPLRPQENH
jgi:hypothetical protein